MALDYRAGGGHAVAELAAVDIATYASGYEIVKEPNPRTPYQAKFSLAYCVAAALIEGRVGLEQFTPSRFSEDGVTDAVVSTLLERIRITVDPEITARYPAQWGTRIRFARRDGSTTELRAAFPRGNPENPVSARVLEDKFRALVAVRLGSDIADRAITAVGALEQCLDMATLFADLLPTSTEN